MPYFWWTIWFLTRDKQGVTETVPAWAAYLTMAAALASLVFLFVHTMRGIRKGNHDRIRL